MTLVSGNDGYTWGLDAWRGIVWRIAKSGASVAIVLPPHDASGVPYHEGSIVARSRGGVYVALDRIWTVAGDGAVAEFVPSLGLGSLGTLAPLPTRGFRFATTDTVATVSPDGGVVGLPIAQWIIKEHDRREADGTIMRTTGAICQPRGLVVSPSNVDWFACANAILRVDERGSAQTFTMPQPRSYPTALTLGGDGAIWFAEPLKSRIGRIDAHGKLTEFAL